MDRFVPNPDLMAAAILDAPAWVRPGIAAPTELMRMRAATELVPRLIERLEGRPELRSAPARVESIMGPRLAMEDQMPNDMTPEERAHSSRLYAHILSEVIGLDSSEDGTAGAVRPHIVRAVMIDVAATIDFNAG